MRARVTLSGAIAGNIAGQPAYTVRVSPKHDGGLLGAVELAFDANHAVPLRVAVLSQGDSTPVVAALGDRHQLRKRAVLRPGRPSRAGHEDRPRAPAAGAGARRVGGPYAVRWSARPRLRVRSRSALAAPPSLVGLPRQGVRLIDGSGTPGAMVVYGHGLGAIVVLEQGADAHDAGPLGSLPRVSVNGASGHELATALGTAIQFDRGGVRYTLVGSLPATAAEAAARALG